MAKLSLQNPGYPDQPPIEVEALTDGELNTVVSRWCKNCGYDLRACDTGRCPECGKQFDPENRSTYLDELSLSSDLDGHEVGWRTTISGLIVIVNITVLIKAASFHGAENYAVLLALLFGIVLGYAEIFILVNSRVVKRPRSLRKWGKFRFQRAIAISGLLTSMANLLYVLGAGSGILRR